jgi:tRNA A37 threonylcarbamoyladenosine dehydratase
MLERMKLLLNDEQVKRITNCHVLIVGVGGVGGACFEALVRLGVKEISIVDNDSFDVSNLNRQILSTVNNIGFSKVKEARLRAESINPDILVNVYEMFLNEANINDLEYNKYDYIIDCCDTMTTKLLLIKKALEYNTKIISSMGTGNRLDATKLEITNIWKTENDPVAKAMRKMLRDNNIKYKLPVLCSKELPIKIGSRTPGSVSLVPNTAGFYIASYVFNDIINYGSDLNE